MSNLEFHPEQAIGEGLLRLDKQELLQFVSQLCLYLKAQVGSRAYHGGIFPENICRDENGNLSFIRHHKGAVMFQRHIAQCYKSAQQMIQPSSVDTGNNP